MDADEAPPPPYSAVDPLLSETNNARNGDIVALRLRGGNAQFRDTASRSSISDVPTSASTASPVNFASAAAYFAERPPTVSGEGRDILHHHMTIYPRSQSKDFPRRPRCWNARTEEIAQQDWDVFLKFLFPPHLGLASSSDYLPRQLRAEIRRDRKDRPQETDEQRRLRIAAVIDEWNLDFFEPRATRITFVYVMDPEHAPASPLCPKCYPAATGSRSASMNSPAVSQPTTPSWPLGVPGQPVPTHPTNGFVHPVGPLPNPPMAAIPFRPFPPAPFFPPHGPYDHSARPLPPQPHFPPVPWGWNHQQYAPQYPTSTSKGGPLGWISQLASQAQKYGERITEQAQQYGEEISAQAQHYGRRVEEHAMSHGRWLEEQATNQGRKVEDVFGGFGRYHGNGGWTGHNGYYVASPVNLENNTTFVAAATVPNNNIHNNSSSSSSSSRGVVAPPNQRPRRSSVSSMSSNSSLTSMSSLSTTSDLSASDLATVRAQLLSLNDHHDRDLYNAALSLRRQLDEVQESRRQARLTGRGSWRHGWGHHQHQHGYGHGGWGRWEFPELQQQKWTDQRAMKEEMKATKKAFRDVLRRAREEQRERRRAKRNLRRQERLSQRSREENEGAASAEPVNEVPVQRDFANLKLDDDPVARQADAQPPTSMPPVTRSVSSSEISSIASPTTTSSQLSSPEASKVSTREQKMKSKEAQKQAKERQKQEEKQQRKEKKNKAQGCQSSSAGNSGCCWSRAGAGSDSIPVVNKEDEQNGPN